MTSVLSFSLQALSRGWQPLLVGLVLGSLGATVYGQTVPAGRQPVPVYKEDHPRDIPLAEQTNARAMLRTGVVTDQKLFNAVYQWRCSQLTWKNKVNETADLRVRLKADLRAAERAAKFDAFDRLTSIMLKAMLAIVQNPDYHPAARLNAMLLLGDLNARVTSAGTTRFVPHPEALPHLLTASEASAEPVTGADDAIGCAALQGLVRHGKSAGQDSAERQTILKAALAIASNDALPPGRSEAVHEWIRRRAVNVLESSIKPGVSELDDQASDRLQALIADRSAALKLRLEAARAFGRTNKERAGDALADTQLARSLGALTIDLLNAEVVQRGRAGWTLRSEASRELLAQGLSKISLALRTVEAAPAKGKTAATPNGTPNPQEPKPQEPAAVQYLRSRLTVMRKAIDDIQANDAVTARNSTMLANDLNSWLDRENMVQATDLTPDAMDEQP